MEIIEWRDLRVVGSISSYGLRKHGSITSLVVLINDWITKDKPSIKGATLQWRKWRRKLKLLYCAMAIVCSHWCWCCCNKARWCFQPLAAVSSSLASNLNISTNIARRTREEEHERRKYGIVKTAYKYMHTIHGAKVCLQFERIML